MRIETNLHIEVTAYYYEIEGLRTRQTYGRKREMEWQTIRARADVVDGELSRVWLTGKGKYVKADGTVGQQDASMAYRSVGDLPALWQERIFTDLQAQADRVKCIYRIEEPTRV
jgi:hypothetical protein